MSKAKEAVDETREKVGGTLESIGEKITPPSWMEDIVDAFSKRLREVDANEIKQRANGAVQAVSTTVKENPVPVALVGAGIGWMVWNHRRKATEIEHGRIAEAKARLREAAEKSREAAADAGETAMGKIKSVAGDAKEKLDEAGEHARELLDDTAERVKRGYGKSAHQVSSGIQEYPLATGAGLLAAGVLAGFMLPATRRENRWFGGKSDELVDSVRGQARGVVQAGREKVEAVAAGVADAADAVSEKLEGEPARG